MAKWLVIQLSYFPNTSLTFESYTTYQIFLFFFVVVVPRNESKSGACMVPLLNGLPPQVYYYYYFIHFRERKRKEREDTEEREGQTPQNHLPWCLYVVLGLNTGSCR